MKALTIIAVIVVLSGCAPGKETVKSEGATEEMAELHRYEATFAPSEYDQNVEELFREAKEAVETEGAPDLPVPSTQPPEIVSGFRVQIISSSNIDEAKQMKTAAESLFPGEWFYLVYDAPAYKLRVGNFLARFEADRFAKLLSEKGYKDAWVVPERVYRNPPPRPSPPSETNQKK